MEESWRWFGPSDAATLAHARQAGARGIVTALHDIPYGEVWSEDAIRERLALIGADPAMGLRWNVVESVPVHEDIKLGRGDLDRLYANFAQTLRNLGACGVRTVCYNFMLILDWARTDHRYPLPGGGTALRLDMVELAVFDRLLLKRPGAEADYSAEVLERAERWHRDAGDDGRARLWSNIMAGLPGAFKRYDPDELRTVVADQSRITRDELRRNLVRFLEAVIPAAEEADVALCIHPDDPPRDLAGLRRIVKDADDLAHIFDAVPSDYNGLTLCTGSLGSNPANDVVAIARRFADRIRFAHLRNVRKEADGSFTESDHLDGDNDMVAVVRALLDEEARRRRDGARWAEIPFRPDHGHDLADDATRATHPGYPVTGRLRGLAELRGVIAALTHEEGRS
ncbi:MAG: mannonate dehydratase [Rubellimicrobium sp.]|nr:mannonate dehydratase [Rubellimicrobium sp.]